MKRVEEKGIISLFVLFSMLFLLVFVFTAYFFVKNKVQSKEYENLQLKNIYSKNIDEIKANENALNNEIIPIYNIDELNVAGTGSYLKINDKIYQCGIGMSYILKDNIIVDIDEDISSSRIGFNDYKLYSQNYHIDDYGHSIYYYKDNTYWKVLNYKKYDDSKNEIIKNDDYTQNDFSLINEFDFTKYNNCTFLMLWTNDENKLINYEIIEQKNNNIISLNQIEVYAKNINKVNKKNGELYIFINIGNKI